MVSVTTTGGDHRRPAFFASAIEIEWAFVVELMAFALRKQLAFFAILASSAFLVMFDNIMFGIMDIPLMKWLMFMVLTVHV